MFRTSRRLSVLEAQVAELRQALAEMDLVELERMRGSVLNALRAFRRTQQAQEARTAAAEGSDKGPDEVGRLLAIRRGK